MFDTDTRPRTSRVDTGWISETQAEICVLGAAMTHTRARLLALIAQFDFVQAWVTTGHASGAHWLAELLDTELSTAREHLRCARALRSLPLTRRAFDTGELSYAKVRQLTRAATSDNEHHLLTIANTTPAAQIGAALTRWQAAHEPERLRQRQQSARGLHYTVQADGVHTITARLLPEEAAQIMAVIDAHTTRPVPGQPTTLAQRRIDAFTATVLTPHVLVPGVNAPAGALTEPAGSSMPRVRPELVLHRRIGQTELEDGTILPPNIAAMLTCDCDIRIMTHYPDGSPADVGRRYRLVTPRLRRLVIERDRHCQHPGCHNTRYLQIHHERHWTKGGRTDLNNLKPYCHHHHKQHHTTSTTGYEPS